MIIKSMAATIVVLASDVSEDVSSVARDRVALDEERRRLLLPGDTGYPSEQQIAEWSRDSATPVAVVLSPDGTLSAALDSTQATSAAWIEDAFVRALRHSKQ